MDSTVYVKTFDPPLPALEKLVSECLLEAIVGIAYNLKYI